MVYSERLQVQHVSGPHATATRFGSPLKGCVRRSVGLWNQITKTYPGFFRAKLPDPLLCARPLDPSPLRDALPHDKHLMLRRPLQRPEATGGSASASHKQARQKKEKSTSGTFEVRCREKREVQLWGGGKRVHA